MAIPRQRDLLPELVVYLNTQPDQRARTFHVYDELVKFYPEVTEPERTERYQNSVSRWANTVQYARLIGVDEGLIYRDGTGPMPRRGVWVLTESGIEFAKRFHEQSRVGRRLAELGRQREREQRLASDIRAIELENEAFEGTKHKRLTSYYERRRDLRDAAIQIHGTVCRSCGFDFAAIYGPHGEDFIEVHHLKMVSKLGGNVAVNPRTDMTVLCANCHRMIHRDPERPLTVPQLKKLIREHAIR